MDEPRTPSDRIASWVHFDEDWILMALRDNRDRTCWAHGIPEDGPLPSSLKLRLINGGNKGVGRKNFFCEEQKKSRH